MQENDLDLDAGSEIAKFMDNFISVLLRSELSETNLFGVEVAISVKTSIQYMAAVKKGNCTQGSLGKQLKIKLQHCNVLMQNYVCIWSIIYSSATLG